MSINKRIESVMYHFRKSGTELAKDLGITKSTITRTLKGETMPSSKLLIPLGERLGVSIDWLLFGEGDMLRNGDKSIAHSPKDLEKGKGKQSENEKMELLEQQIKLLQKSIVDKEEIIELLKQNKR